MKAFFLVASAVFGLLTVLGVINGAYHVARDFKRGPVEPLSLSMLFASLITGTCAGMLYWISKRL